MLSTIKFDLVEGYQPVIAMNIADVITTDVDVRDKIANGIIEKLGYDSKWFRMDRASAPDSPSWRGGRMVLSPVSDIHKLLSQVKARINQLPYCLPQGQQVTLKNTQEDLRECPEEGDHFFVGEVTMTFGKEIIQVSNEGDVFKFNIHGLGQFEIPQDLFKVGMRAFNLM